MSTQNDVTRTPDDLAASVAGVTSPGLPPVHLWSPPFCGDIDMRIARDGTWYYQGSPIRRPRMVRLFSSILKREGDSYFLVTPVEKVGITVDDAPFVAVNLVARGEGPEQVLTFETQVGDLVTADADHRIRVETDPESGEPSPYLHVRAGLDALIDRKSFYRLVDLGTARGEEFGVWSGGTFFPVARTADLAGD